MTRRTSRIKVVIGPRISIPVFGLGARSAKENGYSFSHTYPAFMSEAWRVLADDGVLLCKIADYIHNHRYQWAHIDLIWLWPGGRIYRLRLHHQSAGRGRSSIPNGKLPIIAVGSTARPGSSFASLRAVSEAWCDNKIFPAPQLQVDFALALEQIRGLNLQEALSKAVAITPGHHDRRRARRFCFRRSSLAKLAGHGLRRELMFAVPCVLRANPRLLGYYRLLLRFSQKAFYGAPGVGRFKINGRSRSAGERCQDNALDALCSGSSGRTASLARRDRAKTDQ